MSTNIELESRPDGQIHQILSTEKTGLTELSKDEDELRAQGHISDLPRQFSTYTTLATAFSVTNSWIGIPGMFLCCMLYTCLEM